MGFSVSPENTIEHHFGRDYIESVDGFGNIIILTILNLLIHEHSMSFYLFVSFEISFSSVLSLFVYKSFSSLIIFISKYFILFDAIINGIVFLIFFFRLFIVTV